MPQGADTADGLTVPLLHLLAVGPDDGPITVDAVDVWAPELDQDDQDQ